MNSMSSLLPRSRKISHYASNLSSHDGEYKSLLWKILKLKINRTFFWKVQKRNLIYVTIQSGTEKTK